MEQKNSQNQVQQNQTQILEIFQKIPKGADLHSHYSSTVDYTDLLDEAKQSKISDKIYYDQKSSEFKILQYAPNYNSNCLSLKEDWDNITQKIKSDVNYQKNKLTRDRNQPTDVDQAFQEYHALGNIFYNLIKGQYFYKNYIDLIYENMKNQSIYYQEVRLKLELKEQKFVCTTDNILDYIRTENKKRDVQIKIIAQFSRSKRDLQSQVQELLDYLQKKIIYRRLIIGIDFTGQEINSLDKQTMEDKNILQKMTQLNLQYYNHAGEYIIPKSDITQFQYEKNLNFNNIKYLLEEHQVNHKDIYKQKIRVGHGLVFLQYLYFLKNDKDQQENYKKYNQLSQNVCFEVCPFSNQHFYGGELQKEIYETFSDRICICTDDQNKTARNLSHAFLYLYQNIGISLETLYKFIENSISYSNLEETQKLQLLEKFKQDQQKWEDQNLEQLQKITQEITEYQFENPWWQQNSSKKIKKD